MKKERKKKFTWIKYNERKNQFKGANLKKRKNEKKKMQE